MSKHQNIMYADSNKSKPDETTKKDQNKPKQDNKPLSSTNNSKSNSVKDKNKIG